jgi:hypothetical protein
MLSLRVFLTERHAMKAYWRSGGRYSSTHSSTSALHGGWVVSFTPQALYPQGRGPWYPLDRRLGGPPSRYGRGSEERNSQPLPELEPQIIQPLARSPYRLSYYGSFGVLWNHRICLKDYTFTQLSLFYKQSWWYHLVHVRVLWINDGI